MVKVIVLIAATLVLTACIAVPVPAGNRSSQRDVYVTQDTRDHRVYTRDHDGYYRDRDGNYRDRQGYRDRDGRWHDGPH